MHKFILLIAIVAVIGCKDKKNIVDKKTAQEKLIQNAEPPKPKPALVVENYPINEIDVSLVKTPKAAGTANKFTIVGGTRVGNITKSTTLAQLKSSYGAANIKNSNFTQGAKKFLTSKVYEGQPNEFEVFWSDTLSRKNLTMVKITGKGGDWRTSQGIAIDCTIQELIAINRKDFYFLGFDYSQSEGLYNGKVRSWNNGEVNNKIGISLIYDSAANAKEGFNTFRTLQSFPSNHPDVNDLGLTVKEISYFFK
jgi:hypothetical protein